MSNTTAENWKIDGLDLNTHGWGVEGWGGSRRAKAGRVVSHPEARGTYGQPVTVAGFRAYVMEMAGWIVGFPPDGGRGSLDQFKANWETLNDKFRPELTTFTRTVKTAIGDLNATISGHLLDPVEPISTGPGRATWVSRHVMTAPAWLLTRTDAARLFTTTLPTATTVQSGIVKMYGNEDSPWEVNITGVFTDVEVTVKRGGVIQMRARVKNKLTGLQDVTLRSAERRATNAAGDGVLVEFPSGPRWPEIRSGSDLTIEARNYGIQTPTVTFTIKDMYL